MEVPESVLQKLDDVGDPCRTCDVLLSFVGRRLEGVAAGKISEADILTAVDEATFDCNLRSGLDSLVDKWRNDVQPERERLPQHYEVDGCHMNPKHKVG